MEEISAFVTQFRNAIDIAREKGDFSKDICFREFPRACCGDTSDLLANYLLQNGIIIDITGDQFKYNELLLNYDIPVYIGEMDEFHALFKGVYPEGQDMKWESLASLRAHIRRVADKYADYDKVIIVGHGMAFRVLKYIENIAPGEIVECIYERGQCECEYAFSIKGQ